MNMLEKLFTKVNLKKTKVYSLKTMDGNEKSTHKGHNSFIKFDEYKDTRINKKVISNNEYIDNESEGISFDLFKVYFNFLASTVLAKKLFERKDKDKNNDFVNLIKSGLRDLKDEIKETSEDEK